MNERMIVNHRVPMAVLAVFLMLAICGVSLADGQDVDAATNGTVDSPLTSPPVPSGATISSRSVQMSMFQPTQEWALEHTR